VYALLIGGNKLISLNYYRLRKAPSHATGPGSTIYLLAILLDSLISQQVQQTCSKVGGRGYKKGYPSSSFPRSELIIRTTRSRISLPLYTKTYTLQDHFENYSAAEIMAEVVFPASPGVNSENIPIPGVASVAQTGISAGNTSLFILNTIRFLATVRKELRAYYMCQAMPGRSLSLLLPGGPDVYQWYLCGLINSRDVY